MYIHRGICNDATNNKTEKWFQKVRLTTQWASRVTAVKSVGPSP